MNDQFNYQDNKLSYSVIVSASQGNPDALLKVIEHYSDYIDYYALRFERNKKGERIAFPDEDIKQRVREKLIKEITQKYDITRLPKY